MKKNKKTVVGDNVGIGGYFRLQIGENGKVVGDSGWRKNQLTNDGVTQYLLYNLCGSAGSKAVTHMALGTGTAPNVTHTTLDGELATRAAVAGGISIVASRTAQFTASFTSTILNSSTKAISNIGLFNTSSGGTLFAGQTYASSQWNSNQDVSATYQIRISTQ